MLAFAAVVFSSCRKDTPVDNEKENGNETTSNTNAGMILLPVELPEAVPGATPVNLTGIPNLEEDTGASHPDFFVPEGTTNVALKKPVTGTDEDPIGGPLSMIVDGEMKGDEGGYLTLGRFEQHITVDLEVPHEIYAIMIWHYNKEKRVYFDVVVQIADDPDFTENMEVVFNNDDDGTLGLGIGKDKNYIENGKGESDYSKGKLINAKGTKGRYVRFHSNGNNSNDMNHYVEVAVFGKLVE